MKRLTIMKRFGLRLGAVALAFCGWAITWNADAAGVSWPSWVAGAWSGTGTGYDEDDGSFPVSFGLQISASGSTCSISDDEESGTYSLYNVKITSSTSSRCVATCRFGNDEDGVFSGTFTFNKTGSSGFTVRLADDPSDGTISGTMAKSGSNPSPKSSNGIFDSAQTFNGWLNNDYDYIDGTIQIRTAKAKANRKTGVVTSKVRATIQYLDWLAGGEIKLKKATYSGTMEIEDECGYLEVEGRNGDSIYLEVSADGVYGDFRAPSGDGFEVIAYRDLFSSKDTVDKARAAEALAKWKKTLVFALDDCCCDGMDIFNVAIGTKGKAKVSGMLLGQKFSLTTQLVVGEDRCYLPMVSAKSCGFHHLFYLEDDGTILDGGECLPEGRYGTLASLEGGNYYFFVEDVDELAYLVGGWTYDVYTEYVPGWGSSVRISTNGTKWVLPKAGKVVLDRYGDIDESKLGANPAGLKLSYKAKDGTFSGSFKAYMNKNGRPSAVTVSVSGVMIGREGYGTATVKNRGSVPVKINHETVLSLEL